MGRWIHNNNNNNETKCLTPPGPPLPWLVHTRTQRLARHTDARLSSQEWKKKEKTEDDVSIHWVVSPSSSFLIFFFLFSGWLLNKKKKHSSSSIWLEREENFGFILWSFFYLLLQLFSPPSCVEVTHSGSSATANVFLFFCLNFVTRCFPMNTKNIYRGRNEGMKFSEKK